MTLVQDRIGRPSHPVLSRSESAIGCLSNALVEVLHA